MKVIVPDEIKNSLNCNFRICIMMKKTNDGTSFRCS